MGTLLTLAVLILLIWIARKSGKGTATPAARQRERRPSPVATLRNDASTPRRMSRDMFVSREAKSASPDECWVPPGRDTTIAGYSIRGGMLYVGKGLASINGVRIEPALIDPSLAVSRANPDRTGASMTYWPSYSSISMEARAAYLEWLEGGRRDPNAYIGYVFLFFYGVERRALAEAPKYAAAEQDIAAIRREVEQLLGVYGGNNSFRRYAC